MHSRFFLLLFAISFSAAAQSGAPANSSAGGPPPDAAERVRQIFAAYDHTDTPGCAVGVSLAGKELFHRAWGMADLEHNVVLTPYSIIEAGSVSKQFTAAAILLLAEQGKLSLSDPVSKYFPELPDYGTPITVDQLLHHTSGLRDWGSVEDVAGWPRSTRVYSNLWALEIASHQKSLNYKPGDEWSYTNTGYNLLALLVERVSGKSLAQFTHENIFVPFGMGSTSWRDDFQRIVPNRAIAYEKGKSGEHQLMPFENAYGNGGLLTTVSDLLRWNNRFISAKIGDATFLNTELEPGRLNDGRAIFYADGLMLTARNGAREISHSGATAGYRSWLGYYPTQQLSVAVLCNTAEADTTLLGHKVVDVFLPPVDPDSGKNNGALPHELVGLYESRRDHTVIAIESKNGKLSARGRGPLIPVSSSSFRLLPEGSTWELGTDDTGTVAALRVMTMGYVADVYDRVQPDLPTAAQMGAMVGEYQSDEAEITLTVALTQKGLELHQRPDTVYTLTPTYKNGFECELGSVRFLADANGHINGMSIGSGRVWDLRLKRVETK
jgi:CubicO group peptidase (beta-lactamase class C family)